MGLEHRKANVGGRGEPWVFRELRGIKKGFTEEGAPERASKAEMLIR